MRLIPALALLLVCGSARAQLLASGDVTHRSAVLWMHADRAGAHAIEVAEDDAFTRIVARLPLTLGEAGGHTGQGTVSGLRPATRYHYRATGATGPLAAGGTFTTAPEPAQASRVKLLFGADLGGQGYGRLRGDAGLPLDGFPVFAAMERERADLFLALGDMVYSDRPVGARAPDREFAKDNDLQIPKPGPGYVSDIADFRRDWIYHRSDHRYAAFLRATPLVATWDDHEIVNDSGGPELLQGPSAAELARDPRLKQSDPSRPRGADKRRQDVFYNPQLFNAGRQTMFEFNPITVFPGAPGGFERRLWRSLRWGKHAELIVLDTRSYRDPRYRFDTDAAPKTMLGAAQKQWLKERLAASDATWKLVASTVPLALATGNALDPQGRIYRDGWANGGDDNPYGYARELKEIADFIRARAVKNVVFLTADQHFSNLFAHDPNRDGVVDFHEANVGPLRAGLLKAAVDSTLNPTVLFTDSGKAAHAYGVLEIDAASGRLTIEIRRVDGSLAPGATLALDPR